MSASAAKKVYFKSDDIAIAMRERYALPEWALCFEVRDSTGFAGAGRSADAVAMNCYPSRGMEIHGFEFKVSRQDWLRELRNPEKSVPVQQYCDRWWVVAPEGIVHNGERPPTWGEIEYQGGKKLRVIADAPRLEAKPIARNFIASILRGSCQVGHMEIRKLVEAEVKQERENYEGRLKEALEQRRDRATEALKTLAEIKELTGIDLLTWSGQNHKQIATAIRFALKVDLNGWKGIAALRKDLSQFHAQLGRVADELGLSLEQDAE